VSALERVTELADDAAGTDWHDAHRYAADLRALVNVVEAAERMEAVWEGREPGSMREAEKALTAALRTATRPRGEGEG
jgi:hypothetical protein